MVEVWKFYSPSCGPCRVVGSALNKLQEDLAGKPVEFKSVDVTEGDGKSLADQLVISSVPVVIVKKDGEVVEQFIGCKRYSEYRNAIEEALGE